MGHYIARRCAGHAYLAGKSHFFIYFLVHILVGLDYLSYLCDGNGLDAPETLYDEFSGCWGYFFLKAIYKVLLLSPLISVFQLP